MKNLYRYIFIILIGLSCVMFLVVLAMLYSDYYDNTVFGVMSLIFFFPLMYFMTYRVSKKVKNQKKCMICLAICLGLGFILFRIYGMFYSVDYDYVQTIAQKQLDDKKKDEKGYKFISGNILLGDYSLFDENVYYTVKVNYSIEREGKEIIESETWSAKYNRRTGEAK